MVCSSHYCYYIKTHNLGLIIISVCFFIITSINCWYQLNQHPTPPHGSLIRVWPDDWQVTSSNVKFKGKLMMVIRFMVLFIVKITRNGNFTNGLRNRVGLVISKRIS